MPYDPDLIVEDRSMPVPIPEDRPLTYREQLTLWQDIVPEPLRRGRHPTRPEDARALQLQADGVRQLHGGLLNRLDWDRQFPAHALGEYTVPECCQYGQVRQTPARLAKLAASMYPAPKLVAGLAFKPPYRRGATQ